MRISKNVVKFSECDENIPTGQYTGHESTDAESLMALATDEYTCGDFFIALDDTGKSEETGQGPYYLYDLGEE